MVIAMIYTVTFNPSLDYVVRVADFELGRLHRTQGEELFVGGKGINVSIVLKKLGIESIALGFTAGFTGKEIENRLNTMGISSDFIHVSQGMSRINIKLKSDGNVETEVNGQGPVIGKDALEQFYSKLDNIRDGDFLILSGSVPKSMEDGDSVYSHICRRMKDKHVKLVVDAEGDLLRNTLGYRPFLIKPNHHELGKLFYEEHMTKEKAVEYAGQLQMEGAVNVLVSMAGDGAFLLDETGAVTWQAAPQGKVINSVGAGDSMIAGFLAGLMGYPDIKEPNTQGFCSDDYRKALDYGVAAGSASAFSNGLPERELIEEIIRTLR